MLIRAMAHHDLKWTFTGFVAVPMQKVDIYGIHHQFRRYARGTADQQYDDASCHDIEQPPIKVDIYGMSPVLGGRAPCKMSTFDLHLHRINT